GIVNKGRIIKIGSPDELQSEFHIGNIIEIVYIKGGNPCPNLEDIEGIERIETGASNNQFAHLKVNADIDDTINSILRTITEHKSKMRNFRILTPSLEDVYLKYIEGDVR
ncbi:unnamed protein product, partial [marine sediment metagenome]